MSTYKKHTAFRIAEFRISQSDIQTDASILRLALRLSRSAALRASANSGQALRRNAKRTIQRSIPPLGVSVFG